MLTTVNPTLTALAETILYVESDDSGEPLDKNYSVKDFDEKSLEKLYSDYQKFISMVEDLITEEVGDSWECIDDFYDLMQPTENQTEYDYILTRNRHGAGFWDGDWDSRISWILTDAARSQEEITVYVGDDQKIYFL